MNEQATWVKFERPEWSDGSAVARADAIGAALDQLAALIEADPSIEGGTLLLPSGERILLHRAAASRA